MTRSITVVVHGRGRGHAMRALSYVPSLRDAGFRVSVWAGGAATSMMRRTGDVIPIEAVAPGPSLVRRIAGRVATDLRRLRRDRPSLLLSDGDAPSTYAAAILGIPVLAVGHGLTFAYADVGALPRRLLVREALNALSSSLLSSRRVAVHFADARPRSKRTTIARVDVRPELERSAPPSGEVIAYFRDGGGETWLEAVAARGIPVRWFTDRTSAPPGVVVEPQGLDRFAEALARASGVIGTAGSNLVAECRFLGIPLLALPADDDVEQRLNALIGERDVLGSPVVIGRPTSVSVAEVDRFAASALRVARDGRGPNTLPRFPNVAEAVVRVATELAGSPAQRAARADSSEVT